MLPTCHVRPATIQVLAMASLSKVESVLHKETMAISDFMTLRCFSATCTRNNPSVSSVRTMVPEEHPGMATMFEHLESHKVPARSHVLSDLPIAPTVQAIVVDCVTIVDPQVASIIGNNAEMVMACPVESHAASPTYGKVIASVKP